MTIDATSLSSLLGTTTSTVPSWSTVRGNVLAAVAGELGMSRSDLSSALASGKSMSDLAGTAGVSSDDLVATITSALQESGLPSGVDVQTMAKRLSGESNDASMADTSPATSTSATSTSATSTSSSTASSSGTTGIDTSSVGDVNVGGLQLDSSEIAMLLGSTGGTLDTYL
jgi:hypothetical protein